MSLRDCGEFPLHRTDSGVCVYCGRTSKEIKTGKYACFRKTNTQNGSTKA